MTELREQLKAAEEEKERTRLDLEDQVCFFAMGSYIVATNHRSLAQLAQAEQQISELKGKDNPMAKMEEQWIVRSFS